MAKSAYLLLKEERKKGERETAIERPKISVRRPKTDQNTKPEVLGRGPGGRRRNGDGNHGVDGNKKGKTEGERLCLSIPE